MTTHEINLREIEQKIRLMRETAEKLKEIACDFPALDRNLSRMLATIKMLELNIIT